MTQQARAIAVAQLRSRGIDLQAHGIAVEWEEPLADNESVASDDSDDSDVSDSLTVVAQFSFPIDAQMLQARLEADGIPAWVANANTVQAFGYLRSAVGGVRVMVPTRLIEDAKRVVAALAAGEYALDDDMDVGEAGQE
jgi:hypothetical protein